MPLQIADLACSHPMAISGENHRAVAMTMPTVLAGSVHQALDLALGEVAAFNCEVFSVWCAGIGCLI
jgi:hypothetical protein